MAFHIAAQSASGFFIVQGRNHIGRWPSFVRPMTLESAKELAASLDERGEDVRVVPFVRYA